jgi:hypothetical protein
MASNMYLGLSHFIWTYIMDEGKNCIHNFDKSTCTVPAGQWHAFNCILHSQKICKAHILWSSISYVHANSLWEPFLRTSHSVAGSRSYRMWQVLWWTAIFNARRISNPTHCFKLMIFHNVMPCTQAISTFTTVSTSSILQLSLNISATSHTGHYKPTWSMQNDNLCSPLRPISIICAGQFQQQNLHFMCFMQIKCKNIHCL